VEILAFPTDAGDAGDDWGFVNKNARGADVRLFGAICVET